MPIANGLITLAQAKASLGIPEATTSNDNDLERYIEAATPVIENITGPMLQRENTYSLSGGSGAVVTPAPFAAVLSVTEDGKPITDYMADGEAGILYAGTSGAQRNFTAGMRNVVVVVTVGVATVDIYGDVFTGDIPPNIVLATRELVRHWWQQGRQGNRPAFGNEGVSEVNVPSGFAVPRRVIELCEPHRRTAGFA